MFDKSTVPRRSLIVSTGQAKVRVYKEAKLHHCPRHYAVHLTLSLANQPQRAGPLLHAKVMQLQA